MPLNFKVHLQYEEYESGSVPRAAKFLTGKVVERSTLMCGRAIIHYAVVEFGDKNGGVLVVQGDQSRYYRDVAFRTGVDQLRRRLDETR